MNGYLSIARLKKLTGLPIRDGARVRHTTYEEEFSIPQNAGRTIETRDRQASSPLHTEMKRLGVSFFRRQRFRVFPRQVGLWGHENIYRFCDFAAEKGRTVLLVEALTPWRSDAETVQKKLQLGCCGEVAFIAAESSASAFQDFGFAPVAVLVDLRSTM
jgi:hypothetical protein